MQLARPARPAILARPGLVVVLLAPPDLREAPDLPDLQATLAPPDLAALAQLGLRVQLEQLGHLLLPWVQLGRQVIPARPGLPEPRLLLLDLLALLGLPAQPEPPDQPPRLLVLQAQLVRLVLLAMRLRLLVLLAQLGILAQPDQQACLARRGRLVLQVRPELLGQRELIPLSRVRPARPETPDLPAQLVVFQTQLR